MTATRRKSSKRSTYRHGNLRHALIEAGVELARDGGPEAVVLREATRRAGVAPNAAYRHFANRLDLLSAVQSAALSRLAAVMEGALQHLRLATKTPQERARASLRAVGSGYLRFAWEETGLFRTAFTFQDNPMRDSAEEFGMHPFRLLGTTLDELVEAGLLPAEKRASAEYLAWSAVHGFALLTIDGPLRDVSRARRQALAGRLLDMVESGL